jgi:putative transposase
MSKSIRRTKQKEVDIVSEEALTDEILLSITTSTLADNLVLSTSDTSQSEDVLHILTYASVKQISLEESCHQLEETPSHNTVRSRLNENILTEIETLEGNINSTLVSQLPKQMTKKSHKVAIDLVLIPYHGCPQDSQDEIRRGKAKHGTTHFHCYATAYLIKKNKRITLAMTYVRGSDTLVEILERLLNRLEKLRIGCRSLLLDKEFYTVAVIRYLKKKVSSFIIPVVHRGRSGGSRKLLVGKKSYKTTYTMTSKTEGEETFDVWVVVKYAKGKYGRHGREYFVYAVYNPQCRLHSIYEEYRLRFGIESTYRLMNRIRARTNSRRSEYRLLLVGIALILQNIWVMVKWTYVSIPRRGGRIVLSRSFPIFRFCLFLTSAVKEIYGVVKVILVPS